MLNLNKTIIIKSGKRKTAIAKAVLRPGTGVVRVNGSLLNIYEPVPYRLRIEEPLILSEEVRNKVDIDVTVKGGGSNSQSDASRIAISKAMVEFDPKLKSVFMAYDRQLLVADVRLKETHKPSTHGKARAKKQKSYR